MWFDWELGKEVFILTGTPKKRLENWEKFDIQEGKKILITNYAFVEEVLEFSLACRLQWGTIMCDEVHEAGLLNHKTRTYKVVKRLVDGIFPRTVFLITGSPIRRNAADLWAPLSLIAPSKFPSYWRFIAEQCTTVTTPYGERILPRPRDPLALKELLSNLYVRREKDTDLPPKTRQLIVLEHTPKQSTLYRKLEKEMMLETEKGLVISQTAAVNMIRLRQLNISPRILGSTEPGIALQELLPMIEQEFDNNFPVAIYTPFRDGVRVIKEWLEEKKVVDHIYIVMGGMTDIQVEEQTTGFQKDTNPRTVFLGTIASGASYTITRAHSVFFLGWEQTELQNTQAEDRVHRITQTRPVNCYYFLIPNTVDDSVLENLNQKTGAKHWIINPEEMLARIKARYR
jgi:SNF2 family DNA or RNA helicase